MTGFVGTLTSTHVYDVWYHIIFLIIQSVMGSVTIHNIGTIAPCYGEFLAYWFILHYNNDGNNENKGKGGGNGSAAAARWQRRWQCGVCGGGSSVCGGGGSGSLAAAAAAWQQQQQLGGSSLAAAAWGRQR
jgi:hypothetical protein